MLGINPTSFRRRSISLVEMPPPEHYLIISAALEMLFYIYLYAHLVQNMTQDRVYNRGPYVHGSMVRITQTPRHFPLLSTPQAPKNYPTSLQKKG